MYIIKLLQTFYADDFDENPDLADISTSITNYGHNISIPTSVDHTNVYSSSTTPALINSPPSISTCSVSNDTINRYLPYTTPKTINSAVSTSTKNHPKYGTCGLE